MLHVLKLDSLLKQTAKVLANDTKAGDVIDSRDYIVGDEYGFWNNPSYDRENSGYYQSSIDYQECDSSFTDNIIVEEGIAFIVQR